MFNDQFSMSNVHWNNGDKGELWGRKGFTRRRGGRRGAKGGKGWEGEKGREMISRRGAEDAEGERKGVEETLNFECQI